MGKNVFLLTLVLAGIVAASQAQGNSNHLSGQTSLYLKRAVSQPVDWYPWGADAFQRAKQLNRPTKRSDIESSFGRPFRGA